MLPSPVASPPPASLALVGSYREFPIPMHLARATVLLVELEYSGPAVDAILEHAHRYDTFEGCVYVDCAEHRSMLEETLPRAPEAEWAALDSDTYSVSGDVCEPTCFCDSCDAARALAAFEHYQGLVDPSTPTPIRPEG